jgi:O-acetyl-ADP-ribose deacetylase (regulator of RNase III)
MNRVARFALDAGRAVNPHSSGRVDPATLAQMPTHERIEVVTGDITQLSVDAIVNAANASLLGGSGVDGAIHRAAGTELLDYNRQLGGCPTGLAKATPSFRLAERGVRHLIHTVGPVWSGDAGAKLGNNHDDVLLASCYTRSLDLATQLGCRSVAFPAISTGVYGFPRTRAAIIAVGHVLGYLKAHPLPERVVFCCFSDDDAELYRRTIAQMPEASPADPR